MNNLFLYEAITASTNSYILFYKQSSF